MLPYDPHTDALIALALAEDIGTGDVTTQATVGANTKAEARVVAKERLVVFGLDVFTRVFERVDASCVVRTRVDDGAVVEKGEEIVRVLGPARSVLMGERVALNFLMRLSGIATTTADVVVALEGFPQTRVVDTRKTTPGFRALEKAAVRAGGGHNHRFGLFDGVLIKENHIAAAGGITRAVERAQVHAHHLVKIEVEVTNLEELHEALDAGADGVLLDNMTTKMMKTAVDVVDAFCEETGRSVFVEASGNMTKARVPEVAACGVDIISMGALTHSARAVDISMLLTLL
jgi:nicotinate-nucleotide pyrophosphorylase (carboxylating)